MDKPTCMVRERRVCATKYIILSCILHPEGISCLCEHETILEEDHVWPHQDLLSSEHVCEESNVCISLGARTMNGSLEARSIPKTDITQTQTQTLLIEDEDISCSRGFMHDRKGMLGGR